MSQPRPKHETVNFSTADELVAALVPQPQMNTKTPNPQFIYRGQGDASWQLIPRALRVDRRTGRTCALLRASVDGMPATADAQVFAEFHLLKAFIDACDRSVIAIPGDGYDFRRVWMDDQTGMMEPTYKFPATWPHCEHYSALAFAQHAVASGPARLVAGDAPQGHRRPCEEEPADGGRHRQGARSRPGRAPVLCPVHLHDVLDGAAVLPRRCHALGEAQHQRRRRGRGELRLQVQDVRARCVAQERSIRDPATAVHAGAGAQPPKSAHVPGPPWAGVGADLPSVRGDLPVGNDQANDVWREAQVKAGIIKPVTIHGIRHTFHDVARKKGIDSATAVKAMAGHSTDARHFLYSQGVDLDEVSDASARVVDTFLDGSNRTHPTSGPDGRDDGRDSCEVIEVMAKKKPG